VKVEDQYPDVLQNIEFGIVTEFRKDPSIVDLDAKSGIAAALRLYQAQERQHTPPVSTLGDRAQKVFDAVHAVCEWRLGRPSKFAPQDPDPSAMQQNTTAEIVACLKRIQKSIDFWNRQAGRQGYLRYVSRFIV
jgi:hypothetical protein